MDGPRPAGFWIRAAALIVDFALFFVVQVSFGFVAGRIWGPDVEDSIAFLPLIWVFTLVFVGAYTTVLHALGGQTIGKLLVGVRVVDDAGHPPTIGVALLRYFAYFASVATLGGGYAMAGLRRDKRALHDLIAGTRVERLARRQAPATPPPEPADEVSPPSVV
jgi:uncharacterized RDD family membrane protein YckC